MSLAEVSTYIVVANAPSHIQGEFLKCHIKIKCQIKTWRKTFKENIELANLSFNQVKEKAQDRVQWRGLLDQCSQRNGGAKFMSNAPS